MPYASRPTICNTIIFMSGANKAMSFVRSWFVNLSLRQFLLLVGAFILLISGLFGGMRKAEPQSTIVKLTADKAHQVDPFTVTLERARWTSDLGPAGKTDRGRYLLVIARIRTDEKLSVGADVAADMIRLHGVEGLYGNSLADKIVPSKDAKPQVFSVGDSTRISTFPAGLTFEVAFVWEQAQATPLPTELSIDVSKQTWRQSSIDQQYLWTDAAEAATGTLPLRESGS